MIGSGGTLNSGGAGGDAGENDDEATVVAAEAADLSLVVQLVIIMVLVKVEKVGFQRMMAQMVDLVPAEMVDLEMMRVMVVQANQMVEQVVLEDMQLREQMVQFLHLFSLDKRLV